MDGRRFAYSQKRDGEISSASLVEAKHCNSFSYFSQPSVLFTAKPEA
jgi:hypothetical protein